MSAEGRRAWAVAPLEGESASTRVSVDVEAPVPSGIGPTRDELEALLASVPDPELPFLSIAELGILRGWQVDGSSVRVQITPTYSGCPALDTIREDVTARLQDSGFTEVLVETVLSPAWTTDWLTPSAKAALAEHGIAPPGPVSGPVLLPLPELSDSQRARARSAPGSSAGPAGGRGSEVHRQDAPDRSQVRPIGGGPRGHLPLVCPRCGSGDTEELSRFGATACKALHRCRSCREPFEHVKAY